MVTITCQYTGIDFEAPSKRSKNHPAISALLSEANRDGVYNTAVETIRELRAAGCDSIEQFVALTETACAEAKAGKPRPRTWGDEIRAAKARERKNRALNAAGYRWVAEAIGSEEGTMPSAYGAGVGEFAYNAWTLLDPQGQAVRESAALAAIGYTC